MTTVRAISENGVFRLLEPVDLPEGSRVTLQILRRVGVQSDDDYDSTKRELQVAFDEVDRGEVSDLDMQELLAEAHPRFDERQNHGRSQ